MRNDSDNSHRLHGIKNSENKMTFYLAAQMSIVALRNIKKFSDENVNPFPEICGELGGRDRIQEAIGSLETLSGIAAGIEAMASAWQSPGRRQ